MKSSYHVNREIWKILLYFRKRLPGRDVKCDVFYFALHCLQMAQNRQGHLRGMQNIKDKVKETADIKRKFMEGVSDVHVKDIIARKQGGTCYGDELIIVDLRGEGEQQTNFRNEGRIRFESLSFILSCRGCIDMNINDTDYHFEKQVLLDISEVHVLQNIRLSPDFQGYHILMSKNFEMETMRGFRSISASKVIERYRYSVELMQEGEGELLSAIVEQLKRYICSTGHRFLEEMIRLELRKFFVESLNIIMYRDWEQLEKPRLSREEIVLQFIHLLTIHCKEQHDVAFYARELCIDARYLSRILKNFGGVPANSWIDDALMKEARLYLRDEHLTIGQVADVLHFFDQSAFGKFFKKHGGLSPLNYRRTLLGTS